MTGERRRQSRASRLAEIRWEDLSGRYNARITDIRGTRPTLDTVVFTFLDVSGNFRPCGCIAPSRYEAERAKPLLVPA